MSSNARDLGRAGLVAVLVAGTLGVVAMKAGGSDEDELVRARFVSAAPLVEGNEVKIDGVVVGTVESMTVKDGVAEVTMDLDDEARPLHQDARMTIRPVSLLGERFVDLDRGSPDAPLMAEGTVIPVEQTGTAVGLDEVLNTVDNPTGAGLQGLVSTLGEGMQGNGANVDELIKTLDPSLGDTRALAAVLDEHNELLTRLIDQFEPVAGALATRDGQAMDQLIESSDRILAAVRERQGKLEQTLKKLPGTLTVLRSTLANLRSASADTAPTLAELRPLTDRLPELSKELRAFSDALDPALATSQPVLDEADKLLKAALPVAADVRKASGGLATSVDGTEKVVDKLTSNREDLFTYLRYWALTTNGHDGLSHYFRVNATIDPDTLGLPSLGAAPAPTQTKTDKKQKAGPISPVLPDLLGGLTDTTDGLLDGLGGILGGLLRPTGDAQGSATGLTAQQEQGLVGMLLGGR